MPSCFSFKGFIGHCHPVLPPPPLSVLHTDTWTSKEPSDHQHPEHTLYGELRAGEKALMSYWDTLLARGTKPPFLWALSHQHNGFEGFLVNISICLRQLSEFFKCMAF